MTLHWQSRPCERDCHYRNGEAYAWSDVQDAVRQEELEKSGKADIPELVDSKMCIDFRRTFTGKPPKVWNLVVSETPNGRASFARISELYWSDVQDTARQEELEKSEKADIPELVDSQLCIDFRRTFTGKPPKKFDLWAYAKCGTCLLSILALIPTATSSVFVALPSCLTCAKDIADIDLNEQEAAQYVHKLKACCNDEYGCLPRPTDTQSNTE